MVLGGGAWLRMEGVWLRMPMGVAIVAVAVILLSHPLEVESRKPRCSCDKAADDPESSKVYVEEAVTAMYYHEVLCCPEALLSQAPGPYNITWLFKGQPLPQDNTFIPTSFRPDPHCGPKTLESRAMFHHDAGNYTCTVTAADGTQATRTTRLCVAASEELEKAPSATVVSDPQLALPRESAMLWCKGFVGLGGCGEPRPHNVTWTKVNEDGSTTLALNLSHVDVNTRVQEDGQGKPDGIVVSELTVSWVELKHFGRFVCTIENTYGPTRLNVTLTKGVPSEKLKAGQYQVAVVVMVMAAMVTVVLVFVWWRCRLMVALYIRDKTHLKEDSQDECVHDVFVVHGEGSARWVWSVLVPRLENVYGYTCFLPDRDLHGGAGMVDAVADAVTRCRHVVVVMTGDLLATPWTTWALHQGLNNTLTTTTNIVGLVLQRLKEKDNQEDSCKTRKILRAIDKIDIPYSLRAVETSIAPPSETPITRITKETLNQSLQVPKSTKGLRSRSKSPKNKPVTGAPKKTQDITKGIHVKEKGKEILEKKTCTDARKKNKKGKGTLEKIKWRDEENTVSPSSLPPYLFPCRSRRLDTTNSGVVDMSSVLRLLCMGDPEQLFWQRLRLVLGPPSHLRHTQHRNQCKT